MKHLLALILLLSSLTAPAQSTVSITDRLELSRPPLLTKAPKTPDVAARHLRRGGRCLVAGLAIGLGSLALGAYLQGNRTERVLPYTNIVLPDTSTPEAVMFFGGLAGLALTTAGGVHLIKAGNALEHPLRER